jgi:hypothetical protein
MMHIPRPVDTVACQSMKVNDHLGRCRLPQNEESVLLRDRATLTQLDTNEAIIVVPSVQMILAFIESGRAN